MLFYVYMKYFFPFSFNWMTPFLFVPLRIVPVQKKKSEHWLQVSVCLFEKEIHVGHTDGIAEDD